MTYELDPEQPLDAEVRRIATELIDHAVAQIDGTKTAPHEAIHHDVHHEAVHEVRKDCKKLRGLLRLVRPAVPKLYTHENAAFRDTAASATTSTLGRSPLCGNGSRTTRHRLQRARKHSTSSSMVRARPSAQPASAFLDGSFHRRSLIPPMIPLMTRAGP